MTALLPDLDTDGDPILLTRVRAGDTDAYAELFRRHHRAAWAFARSLAGGNYADDLVAEAFAKVLSVLQRDLGPTVSFRSYLLTTIRTLHINSIRSESRYKLVDDYENLPPEQLIVQDDPDARYDSATVAHAFRSLPERWQAVLWYGSVEGLSNEEIGRHLGLKPNAVSQLGYRAREGLRQAYLDQHLAAAVEDRCREVLPLLPAYVRGSIDRRRKSPVEEHLASCARCKSALADLRDVNIRLGALLAPIVLGAAAASLGWSTMAQQLAHRALGRLASHISAKAVVAVLAGLIAVVTFGLPLVLTALHSDRAAEPAPGRIVETPARAYGPYVPDPTASTVPRKVAHSPSAPRPPARVHAVPLASPRAIPAPESPPPHHAPTSPAATPTATPTPTPASTSTTPTAAPTSTPTTTPMTTPTTTPTATPTTPTSIPTTIPTTTPTEEARHHRAHHHRRHHQHRHDAPSPTLPPLEPPTEIEGSSSTGPGMVPAR